MEEGKPEAGEEKGEGKSCNGEVIAKEGEKGIKVRLRIISIMKN